MIISLFHNYMSLLVTLIVEPHYSIEYTVYAPMWYRTEIENNIYIYIQDETEGGTERKRHNNKSVCSAPWTYQYTARLGY